MSRYDRNAITITINRSKPDHDRDGFLFDGRASYGNLTFTIRRCREPVSVVLPALLGARPDLLDVATPWRIVRDGRVDLQGDDVRTIVIDTMPAANDNPETTRKE